MKLDNFVPDYLSDFLNKGEWVGLPAQISVIPGSEFVLVQPSRHFINNRNKYRFNTVIQAWELVEQNEERPAGKKTDKCNNQHPAANPANSFRADQDASKSRQPGSALHSGHGGRPGAGRMSSSTNVQWTSEYQEGGYSGVTTSEGCHYPTAYPASSSHTTSHPVTSVESSYTFRHSSSQFNLEDGAYPGNFNTHQVESGYYTVSDGGHPDGNQGEAPVALYIIPNDPSVIYDNQGSAMSSDGTPTQYVRYVDSSYNQQYEANMYKARCEDSQCDTCEINVQDASARFHPQEAYCEISPQGVSSEVNPQGVSTPSNLGGDSHEIQPQKASDQINPQVIRSGISQHASELSYEISPQVVSCEVNPQDVSTGRKIIEDNVEIHPQSHEIHPQSHEIDPQSHEIHPQSHEIHPQSHEIHPQSHEIHPQSHEINPQSLDSGMNQNGTKGNDASGLSCKISPQAVSCELNPTDVSTEKNLSGDSSCEIRTSSVMEVPGTIDNDGQHEVTSEISPQVVSCVNPQSVSTERNVEEVGGRIDPEQVEVSLETNPRSVGNEDDVCKINPAIVDDEMNSEAVSCEDNPESIRCERSDDTADGENDQKHSSDFNSRIVNDGMKPDDNIYYPEGISCEINTKAENVEDNTNSDSTKSVEVIPKEVKVLFEDNVGHASNTNGVIGEIKSEGNNSRQIDRQAVSSIIDPESEKSPQVASCDSLKDENC